MQEDITVTNVLSATHKTKSKVEIEKFTSVVENFSTPLCKLRNKWTESW